MIVERVSYYPKPGLWDELLELLKTERQQSPIPAPHAACIYSLNLGSTAPIVMEFEFESYAKREKHWSDWGAPRGAEFAGKLT